MAELNRAVASLRIMGEDLIPAKITAVLGALPSTAYACGDEVGGKRGATRIATIGMWSYEGPATEPADVDAQVTALLGDLTPDLGVWMKLTASYDVDIFCGWFMQRINEGVQISPATLLALGQRKIVLSLDIYGSDSDS